MAERPRGEYEPAFKSLRQTILTRDGNRCVKCGSTLALEVHHIEGYRRNEPELLVTLCYLCHGVAPMGRREFDQWMLLGESGTDVLRRRLISNGFRSISRAQVLMFCQTLNDFGYELRASQLRHARQNMKATTGRCEGRKPFGSKPGEAAGLDRIIAMHKTGTKAEEIATQLNAANVPTRGGKPWRASVIRKILARIAARAETRP
jgi:hypothetical protein